MAKRFDLGQAIGSLVSISREKRLREESRTTDTTDILLDNLRLQKGSIDLQKSVLELKRLSEGPTDKEKLLFAQQQKNLDNLATNFNQIMTGNATEATRKHWQSKIDSLLPGMTVERRTRFEGIAGSRFTNPTVRKLELFDKTFPKIQEPRTAQGDLLPQSEENLFAWGNFVAQSISREKQRASIAFGKENIDESRYPSTFAIPVADSEKHYLGKLNPATQQVDIVAIEDNISAFDQEFMEKEGITIGQVLSKGGFLPTQKPLTANIGGEFTQIEVGKNIFNGKQEIKQLGFGPAGDPKGIERRKSGKVSSLDKNWQEFLAYSSEDLDDLDSDVFKNPIYGNLLSEYKAILVQEADTKGEANILARRNWQEKVWERTGRKFFPLLRTGTEDVKTPWLWDNTIIGGTISMPAITMLDAFVTAKGKQLGPFLFDEVSGNWYEQDGRRVPTLKGIEPGTVLD